MTTADNILAYFQNHPELQLKNEGNGQYRANSPFRSGSNSHAFTLTLKPDGEQGAFYDHVSHETGNLHELAKRLDITPNQNGNATTSKRAYKNLADYAQAHGVTADVFRAAGWSETTRFNRPALAFSTNTGTRYRLIDGNKPYYLNAKGYRAGWYRLAQAVDLAGQTGQPLILCNGEASTVVAQHYRLAAAAITTSSEKPLPGKLLAELQAAYTGPVIVALDCDSPGREAAPRLAKQLKEAGYEVRAVDLALGAGQDLADFCRLYGNEAAAQLLTLKEIEPPTQAAKDPEAKIKSVDYLAALQVLGYSFRLNVLDDSIEVNGKPLSDILAAKIRTQMRDIGFTKHLNAMEDAYQAAAADNGYHPVKSYLESLKYDGQPYIDTLAAHFTDTQSIFGLWLKKWLVGAVAKIYEQYQNPMLVLDGAQGKGKSHFAAWLCPLQGHFVEGAIQPESNDYKLLLATTWIWEVSELGATTRKADREALKAFITLKEITARKPYGKRPINKPAMASFLGTVNDEAGFLNDPTGSRRFLACTLTAIDWGYTRLSIADIWAEACYLYRSGYTWRLTSEEQKLQADLNEHYEVEDPLIPEILRYYNITDNASDFVSSRDILTRLELNHLETRNTMRLSRAMRKLGVIKGKQGPKDKRVNGYTSLKAVL